MSWTDSLSGLSRLSLIFSKNVVDPFVTWEQVLPDLNLLSKYLDDIYFYYKSNECTCSESISFKLVSPVLNLLSSLVSPQLVNIADNKCFSIIMPILCKIYLVSRCIFISRHINFHHSAADKTISNETVHLLQSLSSSLDTLLTLSDGDKNVHCVELNYFWVTLASLSSLTHLTFIPNITTQSNSEIQSDHSILQAYLSSLISRSKYGHRILFYFKRFLINPLCLRELETPSDTNDSIQNFSPTQTMVFSIFPGILVSFAICFPMEGAEILLCMDFLSSLSCNYNIPLQGPDRQVINNVIMSLPDKCDDYPAKSSSKTGQLAFLVLMLIYAEEEDNKLKNKPQFKHQTNWAMHLKTAARGLLGKTLDTASQFNDEAITARKTLENLLSAPNELTAYWNCVVELLGKCEREKLGRIFDAVSPSFALSRLRRGGKGKEIILESWLPTALMQEKLSDGMIMQNRDEFLMYLSFSYGWNDREFMEDRIITPADATVQDCDSLLPILAVRTLSRDHAVRNKALKRLYSLLKINSVDSRKTEFSKLNSHDLLIQFNDTLVDIPPCELPSLFIAANNPKFASREEDIESVLNLLDESAKGFSDESLRYQLLLSAFSALKRSLWLPNSSSIGRVASVTSQLIRNHCFPRLLSREPISRSQCEILMEMFAVAVQMIGDQKVVFDSFIQEVVLPLIYVKYDALRSVARSCIAAFYLPCVDLSNYEIVTQVYHVQFQENAAELLPKELHLCPISPLWAALTDLTSISHALFAMSRPPSFGGPSCTPLLSLLVPHLSSQSGEGLVASLTNAFPQSIPLFACNFSSTSLVLPASSYLLEPDQPLKHALKGLSIDLFDPFGWLISANHHNYSDSSSLAVRSRQQQQALRLLPSDIEFFIKCRELFAMRDAVSILRRMLMDYDGRTPERTHALDSFTAKYFQYSQQELIPALENLLRSARDLGGLIASGPIGDRASFLLAALASCSLMHLVRSSECYNISLIILEDFLSNRFLLTPHLPPTLLSSMSSLLLLPPLAQPSASDARIFNRLANLLSISLLSSSPLFSHSINLCGLSNFVFLGFRGDALNLPSLGYLFDVNSSLSPQKDFLKDAAVSLLVNDLLSNVHRSDPAAERNFIKILKMVSSYFNYSCQMLFTNQSADKETLAIDNSSEYEGSHLEILKSACGWANACITLIPLISEETLKDHAIENNESVYVEKDINLIASLMAAILVWRLQHTSLKTESSRFTSCPRFLVNVSHISALSLSFLMHLPGDVLSSLDPAIYLPTKNSSLSSLIRPLWSTLLEVAEISENSNEQTTSISLLVRLALANPNKTRMNDLARISMIVVEKLNSSTEKHDRPGDTQKALEVIAEVRKVWLASNQLEETCCQPQFSDEIFSREINYADKPMAIPPWLEAGWLSGIVSRLFSDMSFLSASPQSCLPPTTSSSLHQLLSFFSSSPSSPPVSTPLLVNLLTQLFNLIDANFVFLRASCSQSLLAETPRPSSQSRYRTTHLPNSGPSRPLRPVKRQAVSNNTEAVHPPTALAEPANDLAITCLSPSNLSSPHMKNSVSTLKLVMQLVKEMVVTYCPKILLDSDFNKELSRFIMSVASPNIDVAVNSCSIPEDFVDMSKNLIILLNELTIAVIEQGGSLHLSFFQNFDRYVSEWLQKLTTDSTNLTKNSKSVIKNTGQQLHAPLNSRNELFFSIHNWLQTLSAIHIRHSATNVNCGAKFLRIFTFILSDTMKFTDKDNKPRHRRLHHQVQGLQHSIQVSVTRSLLTNLKSLHLLTSSSLNGDISSLKPRLREFCTQFVSICHSIWRTELSSGSHTTHPRNAPDCLTKTMLEGNLVGRLDFIHSVFEVMGAICLKASIDGDMALLTDILIEKKDFFGEVATDSWKYFHYTHGKVTDDSDSVIIDDCKCIWKLIASWCVDVISNVFGLNNEGSKMHFLKGEWSKSIKHWSNMLSRENENARFFLEYSAKTKHSL